MLDDNTHLSHTEGMNIFNRIVMEKKLNNYYKISVRDGKFSVRGE